MLIISLKRPFKGLISRYKHVPSRGAEGPACGFGGASGSPWGQGAGGEGRGRSAGPQGLRRARAPGRPRPAEEAPLRRGPQALAWPLLPAPGGGAGPPLNCGGSSRVEPLEAAASLHSLKKGGSKWHSATTAAINFALFLISTFSCAHMKCETIAPHILALLAGELNIACFIS